MNFDSPGHPDVPILFRANGFGPFRPLRNLIVSPQHRVLLGGPGVLNLLGEREVLAPAKGLTRVPGVRRMLGKRQVTYVHLLLERHEIVFAQGVATESFFPGPVALGLLSSCQRREVLKTAPFLSSDPATSYGPTARRCLSVGEAQRLVEHCRHGGTNPALLMDAKADRLGIAA